MLEVNRIVSTKARECVGRDRQQDNKVNVFIVGQREAEAAR